jgi:hypothetical protein
MSHARWAIQFKSGPPSAAIRVDQITSTPAAQPLGYNFPEIKYYLVVLHSNLTTAPRLRRMGLWPNLGSAMAARVRFEVVKLYNTSRGYRVRGA